MKVRDDDNPDAIKRRLEIFHKDTAPLADFYSRRGLLYRFDGGRPINEVNAAMLMAVGVEPTSVAAAGPTASPVEGGPPPTPTGGASPAI